MATTTNNQGDKPRTTALERQVQTLAAAMEHLTKQNNDLKDQSTFRDLTMNLSTCGLNNKPIHK